MKLTLTAKRIAGEILIEVDSEGYTGHEVIRILLQAMEEITRKMDVERSVATPTLRDFLKFCEENFYAEETPQRKRLKTCMHNGLHMMAGLLMDKPLDDIRTKDLRKIYSIGTESCIMFEEIRDYYFKTLKENKNENTIGSGS